jgi:hypothetical protein
MRPMAQNRTLATMSMKSLTGLPGSPTKERLTPKNSTCSTSLRARASTKVLGMTHEGADTAALQAMGVVGVAGERVGIQAGWIDVHPPPGWMA